MTIGELEKAAGITDRTAFWAPFAKIQGSYMKDGKLRSKGLDAGISRLHRMIEQREEDFAFIEASQTEPGMFWLLTKH